MKYVKFDWVACLVLVTLLVAYFIWDQVSFSIQCGQYLQIAEESLTTTEAIAALEKVEAYNQKHNLQSEAAREVRYHLTNLKRTDEAETLYFTQKALASVDYNAWQFVKVILVLFLLGLAFALFKMPNRYKWLERWFPPEPRQSPIRDDEPGDLLAGNPGEFAGNSTLAEGSTADYGEGVGDNRSQP